MDGFRAPELSDEEMYEHYGNAIANGLEATKLVKVVEVKASSARKRFDFLCRVKGENEKDFVHGPLRAILFHCDGICDSFLGKELLLKVDEKTKKKKMVYGWVISLSGKDPEAIVRAVGEALESVAPRLEVTESPLMGPGTPQGSVMGSGQSGSKGASSVKY